MYGSEFEALARRFPHFRYWPTLSRPDPGWRGRTGHVQTHLNEALDGRRDVDVYLCGLKAMVDDVRRLLKERGLDRKQIFYEKYD
jgi:NAD(P)H-flavin reductase